MVTRDAEKMYDQGIIVSAPEAPVPVPGLPEFLLLQRRLSKQHIRSGPVTLFQL